MHSFICSLTHSREEEGENGMTLGSLLVVYTWRGSKNDTERERMGERKRHIKYILHLHVRRGDESEKAYM